MSELKPCPFCGGEAIFVSYGSDNNGAHQIDCDNDNCCSPSSNTHQNILDAIAAWNTRAAISQPSDKDEWADKLANHELQCMKNDQFKAGFLLGRKYERKQQPSVTVEELAKFFSDRYFHQESSFEDDAQAILARYNVTVKE